MDSCVDSEVIRTIVGELGAVATAGDASNEFWEVSAFDLFATSGVVCVGCSSVRRRFGFQTNRYLREMSELTSVVPVGCLCIAPVY